MRTLTKSVWFWILLLSITWMLGGALISSDAFAGGRVAGDLTNSIQSIASESGVDALADVPLPLIFLVSGLPFALVSLVMFWRNRRSLTANAAADRRPNYRRQTIMVTVLALLFALALWNIRGIERTLRQSGVPLADQVDDLGVSLIAYPVRLFVTFVHEAGHSVAALLSGGHVIGFSVSPDGSGLATVGAGNPALVAPAGYLGAALFGSLLFFLTSRQPKWTRGLSFLIGLMIIVLTLAYAMPDANSNATAHIIGIGFGVGLIALGWFAPRIINVFVLNTLAILTGLNAVFDLWSLVRNPGVSSGQALNDAAAFSRDVTPLIPPAVVAFLWAAIAVAMLAFAMYFGLIKQVEGEISEVVQGKA